MANPDKPTIPEGPRVVHFGTGLPFSGRGPHDGGEPPEGDVEERVRELEKGHAVILERINGLEKRMDEGFRTMSVRFDDLNKKIDKLPNEWAMARVVFYVTAALMAAAIFGPRVMSAIGN